MRGGCTELGDLYPCSMHAEPGEGAVGDRGPTRMETAFIWLAQRAPCRALACALMIDRSSRLTFLLAELLS